MALIKCPRCELNYMQSTEKYCAVCRREMRGEEEHDTVEMCPNCGERPVVAGEEFCAVCLKETKRAEGLGRHEGAMMPDEAMELTSAGEMEEIDIQMEEDSIPSTVKDELGEDVDFVSLDEMEEDDEDDGEDEDDR